MGFLLAVYIYAVVLAIEALEETSAPLTSTLMYAKASQIKVLSNTYIYSSAAIIIIGLLAFCLILDFVAIVMFSFHSLKPLVFLIFNVIQTGTWIALFVLDLIGALEDDDDSSSIYKNYGGWIVSIVTLAVFIGLLIYASVVYHHSRIAARRSIYAPAKGIDYQYQQDNAFDAYRIPTPQPFAPFSPTTTNTTTNDQSASYALNPPSTQESLESRKSRHIDLTAPRQSSTNATTPHQNGVDSSSPYAPRKSSPLSNSQRASSPDHTRFHHPPGQEGCCSDVGLNTTVVEALDQVPRTKSPKNFLKTPVTGEIPLALMPAQGQAETPTVPYGSDKYVVSRQSLSEYQERMYGAEQPYELADMA